MIEIQVEDARGCGFRKPGGLYLRSNAPAALCGKLPLPLTTCPCCGSGIKASRGFTWVNGAKLFEKQACGVDSITLNDSCLLCPLGSALLPQLEKCGLLWVGESFYKTTAHWLREAEKMGISRRISTVPKDFILGETWILMAHRKAINKIVAGKPFTQPAIFSLFKPERIEYVVRGNESQQFLDNLAKRSITPVKVCKPDEQFLFQ